MCWFALLRLVERDAVVRLIDAYAEMLCETRRQLLAAASFLKQPRRRTKLRKAMGRPGRRMA